MVAGTDNLCYKDDLEELWGIRPMELFAGTEPSIMGTETWTRKGMYFFPDTAFYEFITEKDMMRNYEDPSYIPPTYLMDEVRPGENTNSYLLFSKVARLPATAVVICIAASVWRTVKMRQGSRALNMWTECVDYRYCRIYKDFGKRNPQRDRSFKAADHKLGCNKRI